MDASVKGRNQLTEAIQLRSSCRSAGFFAFAAFLVVTCCSSGISSLCMAGDGVAIDPKWLDRARIEIPKSVARYEKSSSDLVEKCHAVAEYPPGTVPKPHDIERIETNTTVLNENRIRELSIHHVDPDRFPAIGRIDGETQRYRFMLEKKQPEGSLHLKQYSKITLGEESRVGCYCTAMFAELRLALMAIDGKADYRLVFIGWDDAKKWLRCEYTRPMASSKPDGRQHRIVWIATDGDWRAQETLNRTRDKTVRTVFEYGQRIDQLDYPIRITSETMSEGAERKLESRNVASIELAKSNKSPAEFRLAAFGFPEPVDSEETSKSNYYLWLMAGAVGAALLAVFFRRIAIRNQGRGFPTKQQS